MANVFKNLEEIIKSTFQRKEKTAENRKVGRDPDVEKAGDVYKDFCLRIAEHYEKLGFKYLKGDNILKKISNNKEWIFNINFCSSHQNVSGEYVAFSFGNSVESTGIKKWSKEQPMFKRNPHGLLGGIHTGRAMDEDAISDAIWSISQEKEREEAFSEVVSLIDTVVIPFFESFTSPKDLIPKYSDPNSWGLGGLTCAMKFLLCYGDKDLAKETASKFLATNPSFESKFKQEVEKIKSKAPVDYFVHGHHAMELAQFNIAYGFELESIPK